ncbi:MULTISPECIES: hypothetical protein [Mycolicibacter]|uniref:hypothetical protein n=1 Tax=Mycolicibacter TaxID=1073531 RepID=UPI000DDB845B|nr:MULTISPECIES: hypothetical protein [Mycolicibacter]
MRTYAVRASGGIGSITNDPHHCVKVADQLRFAGGNAEVVHTDTAATVADITADTMWISSEAYELGHSRGFESALYFHAYQQATRETEIACDVPDRFGGLDAQDYRSAFAAGVRDFWDGGAAVRTSA